MLQAAKILDRKQLLELLAHQILFLSIQKCMKAFVHVILPKNGQLE